MLGEIPLNLRVRLNDCNWNLKNTRPVIRVKIDGFYLAEIRFAFFKLICTNADVKGARTIDYVQMRRTFDPGIFANERNAHVKRNLLFLNFEFKKKDNFN